MLIDKATSYAWRSQDCPSYLINQTQTGLWRRQVSYLRQGLSRDLGFLSWGHLSPYGRQLAPQSLPNTWMLEPCKRYPTYCDKGKRWTAPEEGGARSMWKVLQGNSLSLSWEGREGQGGLPPTLHPSFPKVWVAEIQDPLQQWQQLLPGRLVDQPEDWTARQMVSCPTRGCSWLLSSSSSLSDKTRSEELHRQDIEGKGLVFWAMQSHHLPGLVQLTTHPVSPPSSRWTTPVCLSLLWAPPVIYSSIFYYIPSHNAIIPCTLCGHNKITFVSFLNETQSQTCSRCLILNLTWGSENKSL